MVNGHLLREYINKRISNKKGRFFIMLDERIPLFFIENVQNPLCPKKNLATLTVCYIEKING